jgi:hypothetical protein
VKFDTPSNTRQVSDSLAREARTTFVNSDPGRPHKRPALTLPAHTAVFSVFGR